MMKKMLMLKNQIQQFISNAVNIRRDILIVYNTNARLLIYCIYNGISSLTVVTKGIGLHGGILLNTNLNFNAVTGKSNFSYNLNKVRAERRSISTIFTAPSKTLSKLNA